MKRKIEKGDVVYCEINNSILIALWLDKETGWACYYTDTPHLRYLYFLPSELTLISKGDFK